MINVVVGGWPLPVLAGTIFWTDVIGVNRLSCHSIFAGFFS
jgi:hypothetical protein